MFGPGHPRPVKPRPSAHSQVPEPVVVDPKMVAQFVEHRFPNFCPDFVVRVANGLDGLLIDGDSVGQREVVVVPAPGERHALVKAKKQPSGAHPRPLAIAGGRAPLDDDVDVLNPPEQFRRKRSYRFTHEGAEPPPVEAQACVREVVQSVLNPVPRIASCSTLRSSAVNSARASSAFRTASM